MPLLALFAGPLGRFAAAALVAFLAGSVAGVKLAGWTYRGEIAGLQVKLAEERRAHDADLKAVSDEAARASAAALARVQQMQQQVAAADARHSEDLRRVQESNAALRADLQSGARQLHVAPAARSSRSRRVPGTAAAACVGDAGPAGTAIPGPTAADLAALAGHADEVTAQLRALQAYAKTVQGRP